MAGPAKLHVITGGRYHDFDLARLTLLNLMAETPRIRASCAQDFRGVGELGDHCGVVLYTCDLMPSDEEAVALDAFVRNGGRLFALHGATAALEFTDGPVIEASGVRIPGLIKPTAEHVSPLFMALIGTRFVGHLPAQDVRCEIADGAHPLTRGLDDFTVVDEPYVMTPLTPFRTLITARYKGKATGYTMGTVEDDSPRPQLYVKDHGKGGVLYSPLGHACGRYDLKPLMDEAPVVRGPWDAPAFLEIQARHRLGRGWRGMSEATVPCRAMPGGALAEQTAAAFVLNDWPVLVARDGGRVFALVNRCTHAASLLTEGRIRRGAISCPLHGARFRLETGQCLGGGHGDLKTFRAVETSDGWIEVDVPAQAPGPEHQAV